MTFEGVFAATVTPMRKDESVNLAEAESLYASVLDAGVHGLVCNAHAGTGELLRRDERLQLLGLARASLGTERPLVAGIEGLATWDVLEQVEDAAKAGADAVMLCAPPLFAWRAHTHPAFGEAQVRAVANEFPDIAIVLFQYSANNPYSYRPADLVRICQEVPQVGAIKMATNIDVARFEREVAALRTLDRHVAVLPAVGSTLFHSMQLRPDGALSGSANFAPRHDVELYEAMRAGDQARGLDLHREMSPLFEAVYGEPYVWLHIRYVYCTWLLGLISTPVVRSPLQPLPDHEVDALRTAMTRAGFEPVR